MFDIRTICHRTTFKLKNSTNSSQLFKILINMLRLLLKFCFVICCLLNDVTSREIAVLGFLQFFFIIISSIVSLSSFFLLLFLMKSPRPCHGFVWNVIQKHQTMPWDEENREAKTKWEEDKIKARQNHENLSKPVVSPPSYNSCS